MENLNLVELLRDCPKGMELDCTMYDGVEFMEADTESDTIILRVGNKFIRRLNKYGKNDNVDCAKCVIFPKGKNTWEGFVPPCKFKDGDIVVDDSDAIFFYRQIHPYYEEPFADFYCGVTSKLRSFVIKTGEAQRCGKISSIRYATEEEKQILFGAIKERGYKWNPDTKTLVKLPKFKVGDTVREKGDEAAAFTISDIDDLCYYCGEYVICNICDQDNWELVPNKFDITTLVPFEDKVLIRNDESQRWLPAFWGYKVVDGFITTFGWCKYCVPYKGNEILFKTNNDCDNFYKTWENNN